MTVAELIEKLKEMPQDVEVHDDMGFDIDTVELQHSVYGDAETSMVVLS